VVDVSVKDGQQIAGNSIIVVTFNKEMESVEITISGAVGTTTIAGKTAAWTPSPDILPGPHTLRVIGRDTLGCMKDKDDFDRWLDSL